MIVCSFSGGVADLKPREQRDTTKVLTALKKDQNVSTWDMGEHGLWKTIQALEVEGLVVNEPRECPWLRYVVTDSGLEKIEKAGI